MGHLTRTCSPISKLTVVRAFNTFAHLTDQPLGLIIGDGHRLALATQESGNTGWLVTNCQASSLSSSLTRI